MSLTNYGRTACLKAPLSSGKISEILKIINSSALLFCCAFFIAAAAHASDQSIIPDLGDPPDSPRPELGIEIGALSLLGTDVRLFLQQPESPFILGFRFLDIEDNFINEGLAGLPDDDSDREFTKRIGPFVSYVFHESGPGSYYVTGALYRFETTVSCREGQDGDSTTGTYFGVGYRKKITPHFGYNMGLLLDPFSDTETDTDDCSSEADGDFDINLGLFLAF